MSFPRYPEYRDSGVEWLGEVPAHWNVLRLKNVLAQKVTDGPHTTPVFIDEGVPFLSVDGIQNGELVFDGCRFVSEDDHAEFKRKASPRRDDLLMGKAASTGKIARVKVDFDFSIWSPLALIRINIDEALPEFVEYMLKSKATQSEIDNYCTANTQKNISMDDIPRLILTRPPISEQTAIATFLDHETAKIDALVAEQQKLIALLQEKRQAVISHAVTKGLDPSVPMKDSGVEWLREVPGHWAAITLRRCAVAVQTGGTPSADGLSENLDDGFVWYTPGDFGSSLNLSTSTRRIANESVASGEAKVFPPQSVLIVSIGATLGKVGFAQDASSANQQINAVIPGVRVDGYFLAWSLSVKAEAMRFLSNASTIGIMNQEKTKEIWIALPPREEQTAIATFLDNETAKLDTLMAQAQSAITLLQERRTALISAAVTGQIDVRGLAGGANAPDSIAASAYPASAMG